MAINAVCDSRPKSCYIPMHIVATCKAVVVSICRLQVTFLSVIRRDAKWHLMNGVIQTTVTFQSVCSTGISYDTKIFTALT